MQLIHTLSATQFDEVYRYLAQRSYWSKGIDKSLLKRALQHSLCFALVDDKQLLAFGRVVTDHATFANLLDVFVLEQYRGQGLGKKLIDAVMTHPDLQTLRRFTLATKDAHGLYQQFGFTPIADPNIAMEKYVASIYAV
ncbi:GNAT family N-acetyltransferase [Pseudoalteromonas sp. MMG012]|uniref:GNAT family N-acetyltransferase n=1 Tax=Pseudoalteromonas sp. MMG012 TaxID=2822686 RepID=UPI001B3A3C89|nr:GNAT family N-acetyltransferase [Pseudoalteromonas sp. MMG012]MBQ4852749.1 GNAT family N-acetyltransferase [Pseudoalteromonas sp. MMG012]